MINSLDATGLVQTKRSPLLSSTILTSLSTCLTFTLQLAGLPLFQGRSFQKNQLVLSHSKPSLLSHLSPVLFRTRSELVHNTSKTNDMPGRLVVQSTSISNLPPSSMDHLVTVTTSSKSWK